MQDIREKLKSLKDLKKEIESIERQIEKEEKKCHPGANVISAVPRATGSGLRGKYDRLAQYCIDYKKVERELVKTKKEIEEFINNIENVRVRTIFRCRYMEELKTWEIAKQMNYSQGYIQRLHDNFLKKNTNG